MATNRDFTAAETTAIDAWARAWGWETFSWRTEAGIGLIDLSPPAAPPAFILEPRTRGVQLWSWAASAAVTFRTVEAALAAIKPARRSTRWRVAA
jgi:hypothetical protein